ADAEVEYHDHTSHTIHVRFPVIKPSVPELEDTSVVIWTTTPWTMPGNRAISYGEAFEYAVVEITDLAHGSRARVGEKIVVAHEMIEKVMSETHVDGYSEIARIPGSALAGTVCHHPLQGQGYDFAVPLLPGDFVTTEQGTGFVHIAPGHGTDDYELGRAHDLAIPQTVSEDGSYYDHVPLFAGKRVYTAYGKMGDANNAVRDAINDAGGLFGLGELRHSYPHSWRSKAPLIFRNTAQWFISMDTNDLRDTALQAIDDTRFVPDAGQKRLRSMIEQRPDWCISRQRVWGVPIALFTKKVSGEVLKDEAVFERVARAFEEEGADCWFSSPPSRFLGNDYNVDEWEQVRDIVEVWFESGSTHSFVLEARDDLAWPASLYLEGSDQHRGWFHSSLLESCGTRGRAPYNAVLTHGFVLDEQGRKMSKSLGNVTAPQKVIEQFGADILRLWVVASDYSDDLRIGPEIIKQITDIYRRFRNTFRYLLGNLNGFTDEERVDVADMPELEQWVMHRLSELDEQVRRSVNDFDFHEVYEILHTFCAVDLSSFYFDIRKDALYCDAPTALRRRACRTVLDQVFQCLTIWLAPILCFTSEEAWLARKGTTEEFLSENPDESVHFATFPEIPAAWRNDALAEKWETVRAVRRVITGALEVARRDKVIGSSLQAAPILYANAATRETLADVSLPEIAIASDVSVRDWEDDRPTDAFMLNDVGEVAVAFAAAKGEKCQRCWQVLPEVAISADNKKEGLCFRCADALRSLN
ncbi:MAG: isoleucine--tRNA ligase, partial [Pseudomonadota bacterium]